MRRRLLGALGGGALLALVLLVCVSLRSSDQGYTLHVGDDTEGLSADGGRLASLSSNPADGRSNNAGMGSLTDPKMETSMGLKRRSWEGLSMGR